MFKKKFFYRWWKPVNYIPYPYLKKSWQKVLLDIINKHFNCYQTRQLISNLLGEKKTEEGSYWIDENEPFPF